MNGRALGSCSGQSKLKTHQSPCTPWQDEEQANELVRHDLAHIMARAVQEIWPDTQSDNRSCDSKMAGIMTLIAKSHFTPEDLIADRKER